MPHISGRVRRSVALAFALFVTGFLVSACHTVQGFGEDLATVGNKLSSKAQHHTGND